MLKDHPFFSLPKPYEPRSKTIPEELEKLRKEWILYPEKRWHIEIRGKMLRSGLARLEGHPLPSKYIENDQEFIKTIEDALK